MRKVSLLFASALVTGLSLASAAFAAPIEKSSAVQPAGGSEQVSFEVYLPLRNTAQLENLLRAQQTQGSSQYHQWLNPAQFAAQFGPTPASMARAQAAVRAAGLSVTGIHSRSFRVVGDAAHVSAMLQTGLTSVHTATGAGRMVAANKPTLPAGLAAEGARIAAFSGAPLRHTHSTLVGTPITANRYSSVGPYWFDDLKQAYDYPSYTITSGNGLSATKNDGAGVKVAVLMSDLLFPADVGLAFQHEKFTALTGQPAPKVTTVTVDGGGVVNGPGSFEASLDVQQVLGGAPGSNVTLVSIPDLSDQSIIDGYAAIVESNAFDIVNSSFGGCELEYTAAYNGGTDYTFILGIYHEIFSQGNAQGITFVASSGDQAGLGCPSIDYGNPGAKPTFVAGVSTPADDPDVTAVGGGNLQTAYKSGSLNSAYVSENGYGDPDVPYDIYGIGQNVSGGYWGAGGGISSVFSKPPYQTLVNTGSATYRTLPDVGMQVGGCPYGLSASCNATDSAAVVAYGGGFYGVIGTSVSSPEFVGALALYEQRAGRQGNVNYLLYLAAAIQTAQGGAKAPSAFQFYHRGMPGFDGLYKGNQPNANYSYIYGNGSPDVRKLFGMTASLPAGLPQTLTNP